MGLRCFVADQERARDRKLAMPICNDLLGPGWLEANALVPLAAQPPLIEQLWLLLPRSAAHSKAARLVKRHPLLVLWRHENWST
jgi:hypothetical protein